MLKKIKNIIVSVASILAFGAPALAPVVVHAQNSVKSNLCAGINQATGDDAATDCVPKDLDASATPTIKKVVNFLSLLVGAISVIMIIWGGFKYITSGGDSGKVGSAKNTLLYAIIGIIIVALAQIIVRFAISESAEVIQ